MHLILGVKREVVGSKGKSLSFIAPALPLQELKSEVWARDDYTCAYCGFRSKKYQEIDYKNGNSFDNSLSNLITTCIYCHQSLNLDIVAKMRSGTLVWLPELSQIELHHLVRAIYIARVAQGDIADAARLALDALLARKDDAKRILGTDDPALLSFILQDFLEDKLYSKREHKLEGIRLLPLDKRIIKDGDLEFNQFPQILAYWKSKDGPYGDFSAEQWLEKFTSLKVL